MDHSYYHIAIICSSFMSLSIQSKSRYCSYYISYAYKLLCVLLVPCIRDMLVFRERQRPILLFSFCNCSEFCKMGQIRCIMSSHKILDYYCSIFVGISNRSKQFYSDFCSSGTIFSFHLSPCLSLR